VDSMNQNNRSIVRKRTQQLVYLELGRDNGGVMLNLSEDGCGFQAITPVKPGETRFAFQISGGRRIAGDAEITWIDDVGIMGGLRFLNLPLEARKQIRRWLEETNAPEEHGAFEPATEAPLDAVARGMRTELGKEAAAGAARARDYRQGGAGTASVRAMEEEGGATPAWASLRAASAPPIQDDRYAGSMYRDDGYVVQRPKSVALWRGIAVLAVATAIAALVVAYQHDVGTSLIWLGETLSGRTKASIELPENKPAASPAKDATAESAPGPASAATSQKAEEQKPEAMDGTPAGTAKTPTDTSLPADEQAPKVDRSSAPGRNEPQQQESMLERQVLRDKPEAWDPNESVESLWGAVQGGSVSAERTLAERFVRGEGVVKNCDQAKVLLKAAADRGSREARLRLYQLETGGCR
jgi:PilZ domain